jgi:hypothetical protein
MCTKPSVSVGTISVSCMVKCRSDQDLSEAVRKAVGKGLMVSQKGRIFTICFEGQASLAQVRSVLAMIDDIGARIWTHGKIIRPNTVKPVEQERLVDRGELRLMLAIKSHHHYDQAMRLHLAGAWDEAALAAINKHDPAQCQAAAPRPRTFSVTNPMSAVVPVRKEEWDLPASLTEPPVKSPIEGILREIDQQGRKAGFGPLEFGRNS